MIEQPLDTHNTRSRPIMARTRAPAYAFAANPLSQFRPIGASPVPTPNATQTGAKCQVCALRSDANTTRYVCLICKNLDICGTCYSSKRCNDQTQHRSYHPVQPIVPRKQLCGSGQIVADLGLFCCALCGDKELNIADLVEHCQKHHAESPNLVRCPVCVTFGGMDMTTTDANADDGRTRLLQHLRAEHWNSEAKMNCRMCHQGSDGAGNRFACLVCENYQLCESCHLNKAQTEQHMPFHPMQLVQPMETLRAKFAPKAEPTTSRAEEPEVPQELKIYCCSYCGEKDLGVQELAQHCQELHKGQEDRHRVRCPVCTVLRVPIQESSLVVTGLLEHLAEYHCKVEQTEPEPDESERECTVCMDELTENERFLRCGHSFHEDCIIPWLRENSNCPLCRTVHQTEE